MSVSLPKELDYSQVLPSLGPNSSNIQHFLLPVNGSNFSCQSSSNLIQFDLPQSGMMDGSSLYLKYKYNIISTGETQIRGIPVYTPLQRLQVLLGSAIVENINNYNVIQQLDIAQKLGNSISYGYSADVNEVQSLGSINGRVCASGETGFFSGPLPCILSNAEKLIPLELMPNVRVQIYLDSILNIFAPSAQAVTANQTTAVLAQSAIITPTDFQLFDVQHCYNTIDFGADVTSIVKNMGEKLYIKTSSWNSAMNTLAEGSSSSLKLIYNQRYASV